MFYLARRNFPALLALVSVKAVAAFMLPASMSAMDETVELHDRPWQIVSYFGNGNDGRSAGASA